MLFRSVQKNTHVVSIPSVVTQGRHLQTAENIRIHFDFSSKIFLDNVQLTDLHTQGDSELKSYIEDRLVVAAANYFTMTLKVKAPADTVITSGETYCGPGEDELPVPVDL